MRVAIRCHRMEAPIALGVVALRALIVAGAYSSAVRCLMRCFAGARNPSVLGMRISQRLLCTFLWLQHISRASQPLVHSQPALSSAGWERLRRAGKNLFAVKTEEPLK